MKYVIAMGVLCLILSGCPLAGNGSIVGTWTVESVSDTGSGTLRSTRTFQYNADGIWVDNETFEEPVSGTWTEIAAGRYRTYFEESEIFNERFLITVIVESEVAVVGNTIAGTTVQVSRTQTLCEGSQTETCGESSDLIAYSRFAGTRVN